MKYRDYIDSDEWKQKQKSFLKKHPICELCNKYEADEVHHKNYTSIGDEQEDDLMSLCNRCHFCLHGFMPNIDSEEHLQKAIKVMNYFRNYPAIKTQVLNDVSRKYFNNKFMIDVSREHCEDTPLFNQNLMEIFYEKGKEINKDIVEYSLQRCIKHRIDASKNSRKKQKINEDFDLVNISYEAPKMIVLDEKQVRDEKIKHFCLRMLKDRTILKESKSYMNKVCYNGEIFFNNVGAKHYKDFFAYIKKDNFEYELLEFLMKTYMEDKNA